MSYKDFCGLEVIQFRKLLIVVVRYENEKLNKKIPVGRYLIEIKQKGSTALKKKIKICFEVLKS